ncbi:glyoxylate/hydroxypyruvate reductase A [Parasteatoda tepidariorum]|uniref:glyoxylate/hydroxypyruvate reductase A n=1 Tax=Parasteatoda tepidariorum TaxID=114398 RepID=UPI001C7231B0|nr:glyoxylate/hydroxypyruvate reductase A [Parasteatoda tepidariorum]
MTKIRPDLYLVSRFPNIAEELKKCLPEEVNLIVVPISDQSKRWDVEIILTDEELNFIKDAETLVMDSMYLSPLLYKLPKAKWVQTTWAGVEMLMQNVDKTKPSPNFTLTRYVDPYFGELMSNYVIAQIINIERDLYALHDKQKSSEWARPNFPHSRVISDLKIGILGSGKLGSSVGSLLRKAGAWVFAYVRSVRTESSDAYDKATTNLLDLLECCDYLINVLPSTAETRTLLDPDVFRNCKKKPVFINIGRGDIIKENNIIRALEQGWISKAVLDVFQKEPLPPESPLWQNPGVIVTPHIGAIPKMNGIAEFIGQNYQRYVHGEPLANVVEWMRGY